jgi:hypothetical protein
MIIIDNHSPILPNRRSLARRKSRVNPAMAPNSPLRPAQPPLPVPALSNQHRGEAQDSKQGNGGRTLCFAITALSSQAHMLPRQRAVPGGDVVPILHYPVVGKHEKLTTHDDQSRPRFTAIHTKHRSPGPPASRGQNGKGSRVAWSWWSSKLGRVRLSRTE